MRVISQYIASSKNAGPKAKVDVERILKENYNAKVYTNRVKEKSNIWSKIKKAIFNLVALNSNEITVIQIPYTNKLKVLNMAKNKIGIVHDIDGIRFNNKELLKKEVEALNNYKVLIVHNEKMEQELKDNGVIIPMVKLEIFDYIVNEKNNNQNNFNREITIAYPGNLEPRKAEFLYALKEEKMQFNILAYGSCYKENANKKITHKGSFSPDELPNKLEGTLGLVWSGKIDSTDEEIGEKRYNKFNCPHKLSSFIAAGIPVVVWEKAAIAQLVDKYNIGYKINDLYEINEIDLKDYEIKKSNVQELSKKVRSGYFTINAFEKAIKIIEEQNSKHNNRNS